MMDRDEIAEDGYTTIADVYEALKETVLNLEGVAEEAERALRRARTRLEQFEDLMETD